LSNLVPIDDKVTPSKLDPAASASPTLTGLSALTVFFGRKLDRENGIAGRRSDPKTVAKPEG